MAKRIFLFAVVSLGLVAFFGLPKIRAWMKVSSESASGQIEQLLGECRVRQVEAKTSIANLERANAKLLEGKIKAEVQAEQLDRELTSLNTQKQAAQGSLGKMRDLLATEAPAVLGGKTYTVSELRASADRLIATYKGLEEKERNTKRNQLLLVESAKSLDAKIKQMEQTIGALTAQMQEIDAKIVSLDARRDAANAAGSSADSLGAEVAAAQDRINSLHANVEAKLRTGEADWSPPAVTPAAEIDAALRGDRAADATLGEIDVILGKK